MSNYINDISIVIFSKSLSKLILLKTLDIGLNKLISLIKYFYDN